MSMDKERPTALDAAMATATSSLDAILAPLKSTMRLLAQTAENVKAARRAYERSELSKLWPARAINKKAKRTAAKSLDDLTPLQMHILTRFLVDADSEVWKAFRTLVTALIKTGHTEDEALAYIQDMISDPRARSDVPSRDAELVELEREHGTAAVQSALRAWGLDGGVLRLARSRVRHSAK